AKNAGAGAVTKGMKAFANNTNGSVSFAAAGAPVSGSTETKWYAHTAGAAGELIKISNTVP
ncbi:phage cement protein, partial [Acinetobacter baumannii]|uniref:gp53 minor capsid family protein n=1 Tax=Acinetobacter baumannii TaxID=470 RepID=UPI0020917845